MAITIPHDAAIVLQVLGFPWPEIDEDELSRGAKAFHTFASDARASISAADLAFTSTLGAHMKGASHDSVVQTWQNHTKKHIDVLIDACDVAGTAMDLAAAAVIAMKEKVIAQLLAAAAEVLADQAASVLTFGLAEAALPAIIYAQNKLLNYIVDQAVGEIEARIVQALLAPALAQIEPALRGLVNKEVQTVLSSSVVELDYEAVVAIASSQQRHAEDLKGYGKTLLTTIESLHVSTAA